MKISIIIPTKDREKELNRCLDSLSKQTLMPDEIIIVDASKELTKLTKQNKDYNLIHISAKPGSARQRNIGVKKAKGDILLFLDDDVILHPDYILELKRFYKKNENCTGATGKITNAKKSIFIKNFFMLDGTTFGRGRMLPSGFQVLPIGDVETQTEVLSGCNFSCRKEIFNQLSGFDNFFTGYSFMEDIEFSYRISRRYKLFYLPQCQLIHEHTSSARDPDDIKQEMLVINHFYVFNKHMDKSLKNIICFIWSTIGILIFNIIRRSGVKGTIKGIWKILRVTIKHERFP